MKKTFQFLAALWAFAFIVTTGFAQDQSWKNTLQVYWFGESPDGTKGAVPAIAVGYGGPTGPSREMLFSAWHAVAPFIGSPVVCRGNINGPFPSNAWLSPDGPCGGVRDTVYPLVRHSNQDDYFKAWTCRPMPQDSVLQPHQAQINDAVTWYSLARKTWVDSVVRQIDNLGRLTCLGTLAVSGDSGSPVFSPVGKYVGAVSAYVDTFKGQPVDGALVVTFENPRIFGIGVSLETVTNNPSIYLIPQGKEEVTIIPRKPVNLTPVGNFLFTLAEPDGSIWRLDPPGQVWTLVSNLPPILKSVAP